MGLADIALRQCLTVLKLLQRGSLEFGGRDGGVHQHWGSFRQGGRIRCAPSQSYLVPMNDQPITSRPGARPANQILSLSRPANHIPFPCTASQAHPVIVHNQPIRVRVHQHRGAFRQLGRIRCASGDPLVHFSHQPELVSSPKLRVPTQRIPQRCSRHVEKCRVSAYISTAEPLDNAGGYGARPGLYVQPSELPYPYLSLKLNQATKPVPQKVLGQA
jgi:hypothetical protein